MEQLVTKMLMLFSVSVNTSRGCRMIFCPVWRMFCWMALCLKLFQVSEKFSSLRSAIYPTSESS